MTLKQVKAHRISPRCEYLVKTPVLFVVCVYSCTHKFHCFLSLCEVLSFFLYFYYFYVKLLSDLPAEELMAPMVISRYSHSHWWYVLPISLNKDFNLRPHMITVNTLPPFLSLNWLNSRCGSLAARLLQFHRPRQLV